MVGRESEGQIRISLNRQHLPTVLYLVAVVRVKMGLRGPQEKETWEILNPQMFIGNHHQSKLILETLHSLHGGHVAALGTVREVPGATKFLESTCTLLELALCTASSCIPYILHINPRYTRGGPRGTSVARRSAVDLLRTQLEFPGAVELLGLANTFLSR